MGFLRQLRFLLWKNILIKWRQKIWTLTEMTLPLILFSVIAIFRIYDFTDHSGLCHYDSKGMPSAGLLPFIHSSFCSMNNTCHQMPTTGDEAFFFNNGTHSQESLLVDLLYYGSLQLREIGKNPNDFKKTVQVSLEVINQLENLDSFEIRPLKFSTLMNLNESEVLDLLRNMGATEKAATALSASTLAPIFALNFYSDMSSIQNVSECIGVNFSLLRNKDCPLRLGLLCDIRQFKESFVLSVGTNLNDSDYSSLCPLYPSIMEVGTLMSFSGNLDILKKTFTSTAQLIQLGESVAFLNRWLRDQPIRHFPSIGSVFTDPETFKKAIFCNKPFTDQENDFSKKAPMPSVMQKFNDRIIEFLKKAVSTKKSDDDETHCGSVPIRPAPKCGYFDEESLSNLFLTPLLHGYILVSPASPAVERLVNKLEEPLKKFDGMRELIAEWPKIADSIQEKLMKSSLAAASKKLRKLLRTVHEYLHMEAETFKQLDFALEHLFASPNDPHSFSSITKKMAKLFGEFAECISVDRFRLVESETEMEETAQCLGKRKQFLTGIVFLNVTENSTEFDPFTAYKIRHLSTLVDTTDYLFGTNWAPRGNPFRDLKYLSTGFVFLQEAIDRVLIEELTGERPELGVFAQQEPYPCTMKDTFEINYYIGLCFIISFIVPCAILVKNIVLEKEMKLKEQMRIMGLGDAVHFVSWALVAFVMMTITTVSACVILKYSGVLKNVDVTLLMTVVMQFIISIIMLSLFISTLFTNANMATGATSIIFFLFMFPYQLSKETHSIVMTYISYLFPQTVICYATFIIASVDSTEGANWQNLKDLEFPAFRVTLVECMIALACDTVIYWILSWYVSAIFPGVYGVKQKWYFPFTKGYWFPNSCIKDAQEDSSDSQPYESGTVFEKEPEDVTTTVTIRELSKVYSGGTKALDGLNMRLYESQITALLGHNGAGKTTTMSMLCGLYSPSSGSASVYGRDLRREMRRVRDVLGVCPQQNVLFPLLTVSEQLRFFAALKGTPTRKLYAAVNEILDAVNLKEKANYLAEKLSGGQKRRLCIGIALIGGSKFVILDEPTAGVDVNSRKDIWKLLQTHKNGRTILLSTHHMDEADVLSDRIAVLSEGKLAAIGSPVFLKKRFGEYMMLVACKTNENGDYQKSIEMVVNKSPLGKAVKLADSNGDEVMFKIPINTDSNELEKFLLWFETNLEELEFSEYGISAPRLQQVFLKLAPAREYNVPKKKGICCRFWSKICCCCCCRKGKKTEKEEESIVEKSSEKKEEEEEGEEEEKKSTRTSAKGSPVNTSDESTKKTSSSSLPELDYEIEDLPQLKGMKKVLSHVRALLTCRFHYTRRHKRAAFFELILPLILILGSEIYTIVSPSATITERPKTIPLPLVTSLLSDVNVTDAYVNVWDQNKTTYSHRIMANFHETTGMGTNCLNNSRATYEMLEEDMNKKSYIAKRFVKGKCMTTIDAQLKWQSLKNVSYNEDLSCACEEGMWSCSVDDYPLDRHVLLNSGDRIWDVSGKNLSEFVLTTFRRLATTKKTQPSFVGGFSLGHHSVRAASSENVKEAKRGWKEVVDAVAVAAMKLHLCSAMKKNSETDDLNPSVTDNSSFSFNLTLMEIMEGMLGSMDAQENVKVWFDNDLWPSLPIELSVLSNALLRIHAHSSEHDPSSLGILTINHPMRAVTEEVFFDQKTLAKVMSFRVLLILLLFCTLPAGFTIILVEDRTSGSLHMQKVSGLGKITYWATSFVFDFILYVIVSVLLLLMFLAFQVWEFCSSPDVFFSFLFLFCTYGSCAILWAYILQRVFSIAAMSFILISVGSFFLGAVTNVIIMILEGFVKSGHSFQIAQLVCQYAFILLPQFNLGMGIIRGAFVYHLRGIAEAVIKNVHREDLIDQAPVPIPLHWDLMGQYVAALGGHTIVALVIFFIVEHGSFRCCRRMEMKNAAVLMEAERSTEEDDDVEMERRRVESMEDGKCPLVVRGLTKAYTKKQLSVKGVSFAVDAGECFGLLGLNGAGKTTTFGMLTGKMYPSGGVVSINGVRVERGSSSAFAQVGYCPQFDALNAQLTTRENLVFFARIRSIPESAIGALADRLLRALHLRPYARTLTSALSGGNKRKLSVAIALISQPSLILLDEPSAGMDPGSQQFLWRVIERLRRSGKAVVMTSHSMEECEALCTRIAIMDRGRVRCLGSKQHLKTKFGEGYSLTIKLCSSDQAEAVVSKMESELSSVRVEAIHCSTILFNIDSTETTMAQVVGAVNKIKQEVQLEDFAISQATLDDVFMTIQTANERKNTV